MPDYSLHVEEGNGQQYMTVVNASNAREAIERYARHIDPSAEAAKVEILEVLKDA